MTDLDLRTEIAAIRETLAAQGTSLVHIEKMVDRGQRDSEQRSKQLSDVSERLRLVEAAGASTSDLPKRVHDNEVSNAVQDAVRMERAEVMDEMRRLVVTGGGVVGVVVSVISLVAAVYL